MMMYVLNAIREPIWITIVRIAFNVHRTGLHSLGEALEAGNVKILIQVRNLYQFILRMRKLKRVISSTEGCL